MLIVTFYSLFRVYLYDSSSTNSDTLIRSVDRDDINKKCGSRCRLPLELGTCRIEMSTREGGGGVNRQFKTK